MEEELINPEEHLNIGSEKSPYYIKKEEYFIDSVELLFRAALGNLVLISITVYFMVNLNEKTTELNEKILGVMIVSSILIWLLSLMKTKIWYELRSISLISPIIPLTYFTTVGLAESTKKPIFEKYAIVVYLFFILFSWALLRVRMIKGNVCLFKWEIKNSGKLKILGFVIYVTVMILCSYGKYGFPRFLFGMLIFVNIWILYRAAIEVYAILYFKKHKSEIKIE